MSKNKYDITLNAVNKDTSHMGLAMRIRPRQRVLELGCSSGYLSRYLKEELDCRIVGVEIDRDALQQAAPFCEQTIVADLDSDAWLTEIEGQQFDVVLCADVLEHLKNPAVMLASLKLFLYADGYLLASVPNVAHASVRLELLQGHFDYESLGILDDTHLHFYTRDSFISLLIQAGYECREISYTTYDMADEAIEQHLANAGLQSTEAVRKLLHAPDAVAYQFIVEARSVANEIEQSVFLPLSPKPLVSSGAVYHEKQEKIDSLEHQLVLERSQHQQQISQLKGLGKNKQHQSQNTPNQWHKTTIELDDALFSLAEQLHQERVRNGNLNFQLKQLEERATNVSNDKQRLEQVLQRVHEKISYRLVRGVKNLPKGITGLFRKTKKTEQHPVVDVFDYDAWLRTYGNVTTQALAMIRRGLEAWQKPPRIAVLMPIYNPDKSNLENAIESVLQQFYGNFELCIAGDVSTVDDVRELLHSYKDKDQRIKVVFAEQDKLGAIAANSCLSLAKSDYMTLMGQGDLLAPDALYWVAKTIQQYPDAQLIYADEDKIDRQGKHYEPYFKPDWNPELFLSHDFISHSGVYKTQHVKALGGFNSVFDDAQGYDLALRYVAGLSAEQITHIPRMLYHWREISGSTINSRYDKPYIQAVRSALEHKHRPAEVTTHKQLPGAIRVRYLLPDKLPLVSIVIPTRNGFHLLYRCVESIFAKTIYVNYELLIIDNGSDDIVTLRYLQRLQHDPRVMVIRDDSPFNYSALNNKAVAQASGEIIAFLNNDLEVINEDWLGEMVSHVIHPEVGAVGAKLYYPDNTIQHAGLILGLHGVAAGHSHKHLSRDTPGYCGRLLLVQNLSAVTAACLLVRKEVFDVVGGFDGQNLSVAFNDVDLCLRIQEHAYHNVWTPYAELYHHESASRGYEDTPEKQERFNKEIAYMQHRWGEALFADPAYNPNLTLERDDFSFAWPPRV